MRLQCSCGEMDGVLLLGRPPLRSWAKEGAKRVPQVRCRQRYPPRRRGNSSGRRLANRRPKLHRSKKRTIFDGVTVERVVRLHTVVERARSVRGQHRLCRTTDGVVN